MARIEIYAEKMVAQTVYENGQVLLVIEVDEETFGELYNKVERSRFESRFSNPAPVYFDFETCAIPRSYAREKSN